MSLFGVGMMIRFFVLLLFLCVSNVFAGPLNDINNQIINNTINKPIDSPAWFKDNPNLKILFLEKNGSKALFSWVGEGDGDFFRQDSFYSEKIKFKDPFVVYSADYVNKAHAAGIEVWAMFSNEFINFDGEMTNEILSSRAKRQHVLDQLEAFMFLTP